MSGPLACLVVGGVAMARGTRRPLASCPDHADACGACGPRTWLYCARCAPRRQPNVSADGSGRCARCARLAPLSVCAARSWTGGASVAPVAAPAPAPRVVEAPRRAGAVSRDAWERTLAALVDGRRWASVAEVAEWADLSPTTVRRALAWLAGRHEVDHAEGARGMAGALVERDGARWRATHLAAERAREPLNRAADHEALGEALAAELDGQGEGDAVAELEREVAALKARLAALQGEEDTSFGYGASA